MPDHLHTMSPEQSPGQMTGVKRVNKLPVVFIVGVIVVFLVVMMVSIVNRDKQPDDHYGQGEEIASDAMSFVDEIVGERSSGIIEPDELVMPTDFPLPPQTQAASSESALLPEQLKNADRPQRLEDPIDLDAVELKQRARMSRMDQLEEAIRAKTRVSTEQLRSYDAVYSQTDHQNIQGDDVNQLYQTTLASLEHNESAVIADETVLLELQNNQASLGDRWDLGHKVDIPRTPFVLRAGGVVPAILISGINSELPGQIIAQVSQNVYDTATGHHLLIPLGSRLIGSYSSDVVYGQSRVLIAWNRIVFPDGKALDIGEMPGADSAGYSGFNDKVNNHYFRIFGSAFLMSGIVAGITMSQNRNNRGNNQQRASDALSEALGQQLGAVTMQMISKNLNIAPTLTIRPGYRFNVVVTKDMTLNRPYIAFS